MLKIENIIKKNKIPKFANIASKTPKTIPFLPPKDWLLLSKNE